MKAHCFRWRVVLALIVSIVLSSILYWMLDRRDKNKSCRITLELLTLCVRDRKSICEELGIDEDGLDAAISDNPYHGMALYCMRLNMPHSLVVKEADNGQLRVIDPWGRPFKVQARGVRHYQECCAPYFQFGRHRIRIWSVGPNGIDDRGEGDDIIMHGAYVGYESFALPPDKADKTCL